MATDKIYVLGHGEPENYVPGKFHPVHFGDALGGRYHVFRKLGLGSQGTVWLARDKDVSKRRFVAVKVFGAKTGETEIKLDKILHSSDHSGKKHVELALHSFMVRGPNGDHFCKVLEPLGRSSKDVLDWAFETRSKFNFPNDWLGKVLEGDPWSAKFAKRACWQILLGLDYLHSQRVAHRDIQPANVCMALDYDLSLLSENEIQRAVWRARVEEIQSIKDAENQGKEAEEIQIEKAYKTPITNPKENQSIENKDISPDDDTSSNEDSDSDNRWIEEYRRELKEQERLVEEKWQAYNSGDELAEPLSDEWNKANFFNSRDCIRMLERTDGKPLKPDEIRYVVGPTPLEDEEAPLDLDKPFRLVLVDLGFACSFDDCSQRSLKNLSDFRPPECLLDIPTTYKADIFSLGLLFWEIVMLRRLVEAQFNHSVPGYTNNRLMHDLANRLGPIPGTLRAQWHDADKFVAADGSALDMQEEDGEEYDEDHYLYGDIWHHARSRKPLDMDDSEMEIFVAMVKTMLQWEPDIRPSTKELLKHEWFKDLAMEGNL